MRDTLQNLVKLDIGACSFDAPLSHHSWWQIGGPADLLVEPGSIEQVQTLMRELDRLALPYVVIGDASNLLFDDQGVRGVVIKIGRSLSQWAIQDQWVTAEAGAFVPRLVRRIGGAGLSGLEHAIGIPGTLGGLVLMNGGSMRQGVGSHVDRVWAVDREGVLKEYDHAACSFAYRHSALQMEKVVVVRVRLHCSQGDKKAIRREMLDILRSRRYKFPLKLPNCGSVFISDPAMYTIVGPPGKIIEDAGFKGYRVGDAMIPAIHANFIVNLGAASSEDVLAIIRTVRLTVFQRTGFWLQCEVRYVSPDCRVMPAHYAVTEDRQV